MWGEVSANVGVGSLLAAAQQLPIGRTFLQRIYLRHRHYGMIELEKLTVPGIRRLHHQQTSKSILITIRAITAKCYEKIQTGSE
jgi:hypothetical protein